jgi:hypothetical protein
VAAATSADAWAWARGNRDHGSYRPSIATTASYIASAVNP